MVVVVVVVVVVEMAWGLEIRFWMSARERTMVGTMGVVR